MREALKMLVNKISIDKRLIESLILGGFNNEAFLNSTS